MGLALHSGPSPPVCGETQGRGYRTEGSGQLRAQHSTNPHGGHQRGIQGPGGRH